MLQSTAVPCSYLLTCRHKRIERKKTEVCIVRKANRTMQHKSETKDSKCA